MGSALASEGIETTLITDSAVFPIMSRVNKVSFAFVLHSPRCLKLAQYDKMLSSQCLSIFA